MLNIVTDGSETPVLYWFDLSPKEQAEFDYHDTETAQGDARFFRHKDTVYDLGEFCRIAQRSKGNVPHPCTLKVDDDSPLLEWHGYHSDTYFSMTLVRYTNSDEDVVVGMAYS